MSKHYERDTYTQTVLTNAAQIPGEILLHGFTVYNHKGTAQFVLLFDNGTEVPPNGNVPAAAFPVGADQDVDVYYGESGRLCKYGLSIVNSSTDTALTKGSADCLFDIQYSHVFEED